MEGRGPGPSPPRSLASLVPDQQNKPLPVSFCLEASEQTVAVALRAATMLSRAARQVGSAGLRSWRQVPARALSSAPIRLVCTRKS